MTDSFSDDPTFDDALDCVLDQPRDQRAAFAKLRYAKNPDLVASLLKILSQSEAGGEFLEIAEAAASNLLHEESTEDGGFDPNHDTVPDPTSIGPYRVLSRLGEGGMGVVYLAERDDLDRRVALKVVRGAYSGAGPLRRFHEEQRLLSRLEHPGIARLYDVGVDDKGAPFLAMEFVSGRPINAFADEETLDVRGRLKLIRQVLEALGYAHRNLIVHRDVKPGNILVSASGDVKLLDFGVAKLLEQDGDDSDGPLTRPGTSVLTPEYASPEQIRGEPVTTATDVYAVGILAYELLTGQRPYTFSSRSPLHLEKVVSEQDPKRPSAVAAGASLSEAAMRGSTPTKLAQALAGDLDAILLTALQKDPARRYGSVMEMAADLDRFRDQQPVLARVPTRGYRARRFVARNRGPVLAGLTLILTLLVGAGGTWWQAQAATHQAARAERVKDLLVEVFQGADPDESLGEDLSAIDLLRRGEDALSLGLNEDPQVKAELQEILGELYTSLGDYDRAEVVLASAVELRESEGEVEGRLSAGRALADLLYAQGKYEQGEVVARDVLRETRGEYPEVSAEVAAGLTDLASFILNQGRFEEADSLIRIAIDMDQALGRKDLLAVDLNNLGSLQTRMGRYDEGIELLESSLALRRELYSGDHTDVATSAANLAWALDQKGLWDRADPLYEEALAMRKRLLGEEHPLVAILLNNQAGMRQKEGRLAEARTLHTESLRIRRSVYGPDHADVAASLNNLGLVAYYERDYPAAEQAFREALRVFRLNRSEDHPHVLTATSNLGATLRAQDKHEDAERLIRSTLEVRLDVLGPDHHNTGGSWNILGGILAQKEQYPEAEAAISEALRIFRSALSPDHPDLADALLNLGRMRIDANRSDEALDVLRESCSITATRYDPGTRQRALCDAALGVALAQSGGDSEALRILIEAVPVLQKEAPDHSWTARAEKSLRALSGS